MRNPRVLVVDDEPETVKYVSANLHVRGYDVLTAEDGRTALKTFGESVVDLIILDMRVEQAMKIIISAGVVQENTTANASA